MKRIFRHLPLIILTTLACQNVDPPPILWEVEIDDWTCRGLAMSSDGTIYITAMNLYAINSEGEVKWEFEPDISAIITQPVIGPDGTIYFSTHYGYLYAIDPDGDLLWENQIEGWTIFDIAIGSDGTIYCASDNGYLGAFDNNGEMLWGSYFEDALHHVCVAIDKTIYGIGRSALYAINPDGKSKWEYDPDEYNIETAPALDEDGTIYLATTYDVEAEQEGYLYTYTILYAVNSDGSLKWKNEVEGEISNPPVIDDNGIIYLPTLLWGFYAVASDGIVKWNKDNHGNLYDSHLNIDSEGSILFTTNSNTLASMNSNGRIRWVYEIENNIYSSPIIGDDGVIYFVHEHMEIPDSPEYDRLYLQALEGTSSGLADSPWPRAHHDNRNTSCAANN